MESVPRTGKHVAMRENIVGCIDEPGSRALGSEGL